MFVQKSMLTGMARAAPTENHTHHAKTRSLLFGSKQTNNQTNQAPKTRLLLPQNNDC
jgi:hypothetical protein